MANVFLALPTYDGTLSAETAQAAYGAATQRHRVFVVPLGKSLLAANCNSLLAMCYNEMARLKLDWFAMLHADIDPAPWWLDTLIDEAEAHQADLMSTVVPIKNEKGLTSTAIGYSSDSIRQFGRLTMRQVQDPSFPRTFGIAEAAEALHDMPAPLDVVDCPRNYLLANTGCMVFRLKDWPLEVSFQMRDGMERLPDGRVQAWGLSEDWYFARSVAEHGGKVMCTTKVRVEHIGKGRYPNDHAWGTVVNDCEGIEACVPS